MKTIFVARWLSGSRYELEEYLIHTFSNTVYDPIGDRLLVWMEKVDLAYGEEPEIAVDRVLLCSAELGSAGVKIRVWS